MAVEPPLQPLTGEAIVPTSANCRDDARADIHARGFWGRRQGAFFDIRVFHPNAPSYRRTQVGSLFRRHELDKKRAYADRVRSGTYYSTERNGTERLFRKIPILRNDQLRC